MDKELIKQEIESYKESMKSLWPHSDFRRGQITAYNQILQFIDSLPESGCEVDFTTKDEDLEKAAEKYSDNASNIIEWSNGWEDINDCEYVERAFKAGAKWQKEQDNICYEEIFEEGAKWQREQYMQQYKAPKEDKQ